MLKLETIQLISGLVKKLMLTFSTLFLLFHLNNKVFASEILQNPLGKWPLLAKYVDSDCLDVDDDRLDFVPSAIAKNNTIRSKFALASYGGKVFVNPQIHRGWQSISFSIDSATTRVEESGISCFQVMEIEIKAWPKKYEKLFIVQDKGVRYEIPIRNLGEY